MMQKRVFLIILSAVLILSCTGCKSQAEKELEEAQAAAKAMEELAENAQKELEALERDIAEYEEALAALNGEKSAETGSEFETVDALLQGIYGYEDTRIGFCEELTFVDGSLAYTSWIVDLPEKATTSLASYTIEEKQIVMYYPATDYTDRMDYTVQDGELTLYNYIDAGADAGNTRVYRKRSVSQAPEQGQVILKFPETSKPDAPADRSSSVTAGMKNALQSAKNYLDFMPFSYSGLIDQLKYEGYTDSEATYAADNCGADWYEQAVRSAENYLEFMSFSRSGLIDQLEYEGYTHDQAVYGVEQAY